MRAQVVNTQKNIARVVHIHKQVDGVFAFNVKQATNAQVEMRKTFAIQTNSNNSLDKVSAGSMILQQATTLTEMIS